MSRSGYSDDCENSWASICWRGAVASSIRGARGQKLLTELLSALDAMPEKALIADELVVDGSYCALGVVGAARGIDMTRIDPYDRDQVGKAFDISPALAAEIVWINDDEWSHYSEDEMPEHRWKRVRAWVANQIIAPAEDDSPCAS